MMGGFGFGGIGMGVGLLFFVGLVFLVVWLIGQSNYSGATRPTTSSSALEILKTRYAKGEITKAQYDQMKSDVS